MLFHSERDAHLAADLLGDLGGLLQAVDLREENQELVTTHASHCVGLTQAPLDAPRHLDEKRITDGVAVGVVDMLELVQIAVQNAEPLTGAWGMGQHRMHGLQHRTTVLQIRQRIVVSMEIEK